jgi:hypothetical protein
MEKALSLSQSLGSSLKDSGIFGPLSPTLSGPKVQQLLLSPRAAMAAAQGGQVAAVTPRAAMAAAMAAAAAGGLGWQQQEAVHELPMEEMMTADIFDLE